jgi:hypothetical protein
MAHSRVLLQEQELDAGAKFSAASAQPSAPQIQKDFPGDHISTASCDRRQESTSLCEQLEEVFIHLDVHLTKSE